MFYFHQMIITVVLCLTPGLLASRPLSRELSNFNQTEAIKEATQAFASQLNSTLSSLSTDLHGLPAYERSFLLTSLHSTLTDSFAQRLADEVQDSKEHDFTKNQAEFWASVKNGMGSDLKQFLSEEIYSKSSLSLAKRDGAPAPKVSLKFKLQNGLDKIGMGLDKFFKFIYYKGIKIPFFKLRQQLQILWLKIKLASKVFSAGAHRSIKEAKEKKKGAKELPPFIKEEFEQEVAANFRTFEAKKHGVVVKYSDAVAAAEHAYKRPFKGFFVPKRL
jgi:hypothetical protein